MSHLLVISFFGSCNKKIYKSPIQPHAWNFKFWLTQCKGSHKIALSWEVIRFTTRHDVIHSKLLQKPIYTLAFSHNLNEIIVQLGISILLCSPPPTMVGFKIVVSAFLHHLRCHLGSFVCHGVTIITRSPTYFNVDWQHIIRDAQPEHI